MQESARAALPAGYFVYDVAIEGDWILASASNSTTSTISVYLYQRRSASSWTLNRTLLQYGYDPESISNGPHVAMESGLATVIFGNQIAVFERANGWARASVTPAVPAVYSDEIKIDGQRILVGTGNCGDAAIFERDATGTWSATSQLKGSGTQCGEGSIERTRTLDLSGDYAFVPTTSGTSATNPFYIFRRNAATGQWARVATLPMNEGYYIPDGTALRGSIAIASPGLFYYKSPSLHWWVRSGSTWTSQPTIRALDAFAGHGWYKPIKQRGDWLVQLRANPDGGSTDGSVIDVYRQTAAPRFDRVARLAALTSSMSSLGVYDNRIVAGTTSLSGTAGDLVIFELPANLATPAPIRDDFEGGNSASWQTAGGAQFSIVAANDTHWYRQAGTAAFATATLGNSDWVNQAIEAEVGASSNTSTLGYVGLGVRWDGAASGYFARVRNDNTLQLVKRVAGVETVLGSSQSANYSGRHRLQIEARGRLLTVYVDGLPVLRGQDAALKHGSAVLVTSSTPADFDNVYVSPLRQAIFNSEFNVQPADAWTENGGTWDYALATESATLFKTQLAATGAARAITGVATDDQVNETRVRADTASTSDSSWVGVMARYVDAHNLYYLSLRGGRQLLLRKVVNGVATDLWYEYPALSSGAQFHTLRLEATGDRLRASIDGQFQFEVRDTDIARGRPGIATNNSKATFATFLSYQP